MPAIQCTLSVDNYIYVEELNLGSTGAQPHNFVIKDGIEMNETHYFIPRSSVPDFKWMIGSNKDLEIYIYDPKSNIVVNTKEANISFIMVDEYNPVNESDNEIVSLFIIPFSGQSFSQMLNISNYGKWMIPILKRVNYLRPI